MMLEAFKIGLASAHDLLTLIVWNISFVLGLLLPILGLALAISFQVASNMMLEAFEIGFASACGLLTFILASVCFLLGLFLPLFVLALVLSFKIASKMMEEAFKIGIESAYNLPTVIINSVCFLLGFLLPILGVAFAFLFIGACIRGIFKAFKGAASNRDGEAATPAGTEPMVYTEIEERAERLGENEKEARFPSVRVARHERARS